MVAARELLHKLLEYIREQAKDIDPRGFRLEPSKYFLRRREDIAALPGVEFDLKVAGDHIWLRVPRLEANSPPPLPEKQKGIFRVSQDPDGPLPSLDEAGFISRLGTLSEGMAPEERAALERRSRARAATALEEYTGLWKSWTEGERPRRKTIALYGELFALKYQLEAEETAKPQECLWGVGISSWQVPFDDASIPFEYPLLTQSIEISLDEQTMALDLRPRATGTRVEMDAFIACQITGAAGVERTMQDHLARNKDRPVTPFDPSSYSDVLKLAAGNLDSEGSYREILLREEPVPLPAEHLVVTDAWVLLSRPRSNNYFFEDLKRLQAKLEDGCDIPPGPSALVTPPSDKPVEYEPVRFRGLSSRGDWAGSGLVEELCFPLPYNEEQITIVQRLERAPGVTVQGPPGTGKTHTIANIICHYLATGRRVLVTSRGDPALKVLQSLIPEEVRPLTVALLASDREGVRQFQASIEAIQHRVSQLNPEQIRSEIGTHQNAIDRAHSEISFVDKRINEIAIAQLSEVEVDGTALRAQRLAELVISGREQHGWFDDSVSLVKKHAPPLSEDEAGQLREARRKVGADLIYVQACIPPADDLPSTPVIAELHDVRARMKCIEAEIASGNVLSLKAATPEILQAARELLARVKEAKDLVEELEAFENGWPLDLRVKCRSSSFASERKALESLFSDLDGLIQARADFLKRPVEFPEAGLTSLKTKEAVERAAGNGKPFGLISIGKGEAKDHIAAIRVAGLAPSGIEDWAHVLRFIGLHEKVLSFLTRWNQLAEGLSIPRLKGGVATLRRVEVVATAAKKAHRLAMEYDAVLPKKAEEVFDKAPVRELVGRAADLTTVCDHLARHLTKSELSRAAIQLSALQEKLAGKTGPVTGRLRAFVENTLGSPSLPPERAVAQYSEILVELRRISGLSLDLSCIRDLAKRIEDAGAPKFAARVRTEPVQTSGEDKSFPFTWREAWNWARICSHLDTIEARDELVALSRRRRDLEGGLARLYREMVAKAAWLSTKRNSTPKVLQALAGYATAIRRIGQGTGPNATRYRRDAREAMLEAAGAVPCWIMNHARVSEAMPADIGAFDLVIVDEASQSDLWSLPAILRGKKILVVGDDKQVSPDPGFIASQRIQELRDRFLFDQPYGAEMTPEKSLYDLAARVFAAEQVMLREHFRCVPPIIAYSNRIFYKGGIYPLRIPKASERIDPALVDILVSNGVRDKKDRNEQEAQAIADEIEAILKDEHFANRTIGVVSLLGMEQAKHIDSLVRQRCSAVELLHRGFQCGDARTFQGSERDIMFLSLVVDTNSCKAISGNLFEQRFNVAASRARDRMYLVRSVKASDLSDKDLRLTLLGHFDRPLVTDKEEAEKLIDRCESRFEREVYSELIMRGYRVTPQVKTGAYRIDMVVEGAGDTRLAIECDGDEYHGPDQWQNDMKRQRILERAGWVFWRCFASTWSLHKDEVLGELLERFKAIGIEPLGAIDHTPNLVEKRIWKQTQTENEKDKEARLTLDAAVVAAQQNKQEQLPLKQEEKQLPHGQMDFNHGRNERETHRARTNDNGAARGEALRQPGGLSPRIPQQDLTAFPPAIGPGEYQPEVEQLWVVSKGSSALRKLHKWSKESGDFKQSDVSLIYWVAQDIEKKKKPSPGNARKVRQLWEKAVRKGFRES
jgi:very-short-patch-repair endonuclease